jgi:hypothetical protein
MRSSLEQASEIFAWLEQNRRIEERADVLATTAFPALLSDLLHCAFEALVSFRKANLGLLNASPKVFAGQALFPRNNVADRLDFATKLRATATYLDIWLMRRATNYVRVGYSSTAYAMFLLCRGHPAEVYGRARPHARSEARK